jgi:2-polyprenyl-6-methoxyphenol hydroxylase-like FAD-dependent oxidoreductase
MDYEVVIAGAGPVGLMLACELRLAGTAVLVLERMTRPGQALKAGAMGARSVSAPSADAFHRRGLLPAVEAAATWWYRPAPDARVPDPRVPDARVPVFVGHFAGLPIRADRLDPADPGLAGNSLGGGVISMERLEAVLSDRAAALGVEVRRGAELTGLRAGRDGVTIQAGDQEIRAGWLVGCDGGRSTVRKLAGFSFPGTDAEFTGRQAMVEFAEPERLPLSGWIRTDTGAYTHGPVPGRIHTVQYDSPAAGRDAPVSAAELEASLRAVSGLDVTIKHVMVATRYTDQTRQATTYRDGRVLLAGDAAHIHSPAGGQGLNLGIGDAMNLGWKLAATVAGWAPEHLLDSYTAERHPLGARVQGWSDAQSALGRPDARTKALRDVVADLLDTRAGATYVLRQISGLGQRYDLPGEHPLIGGPAPDLLLDTGGTLAERGHDGKALLVDLTGRAVLDDAGREWGQRLHVTAAAAAQCPSLSALLVRPDGFVAWATDGEPDPRAARAALTAWLGAPATPQPG